MKTVAINALNSNSGGGKSIRDSFLRLLNEQPLEMRYVVIVPKGADLAFLSNPHIELLELPAFWSRGVLAPLVYRFVLGSVIEKVGAQVVLNLGDLVVMTKARQLYVFDWPYALDVHKKVWSGMSWGDWLSRKTKLALLRRDFARADIVVAQTAYIRDRLLEKYHLRDVRVIGNAPTIQHGIAGEGFDLPAGVLLVSPSVYYPHKNLEVLLDLATLVQARGRDYRIVTTVSPVSSAARSFLDSIDRRGLRDMVINVGQVPHDRMAALYSQCDGLIMPTLLESFSIVYPEAMHHGLPIFTSDLWFAHSVCGEAAAYFDPFDAEDILRSLDRVYGDPSARDALIDAGRQQLAAFPSWPDNFASYQALIKQLLDQPTYRAQNR